MSRIAKSKSAPGTVDLFEKAGSTAGEILMVVNTTASRCDHPLQGNGTSYNPSEFTRDETDANRRVVRVVGEHVVVPRGGRPVGCSQSWRQQANVSLLASARHLP